MNPQVMLLPEMSIFLSLLAVTRKVYPKTVSDRGLPLTLSENPRHLSLSGLPSLEALCPHCHTALLGELCPCWVLQGRDAWKFAPGSSCTSLHAPFSFADFNPCPFTEINGYSEHKSAPESCESS